MKKLLFYGGLVLIALFGLLVYNYNQQTKQSGAQAYMTNVAPWQPARLRIPNLSLDAPVIGVGSTASGKMDAPTSQAINSPYWTSVFWYELGAAPGQAGNAIIAGHIDRVGGDPAVFWSLNTLAKGAQIFIVTGEGKTLTYVVDGAKSYSANDPGEEAQNDVFGPTNQHHLNLITCSGAWTENGYDQRLVVFTHQENT
ncbi:class F sortase [Ktedonospora formicarum]|uniref:Class F sortase n=1 Tax=Ktedonospora formicarum TaxID=2778364 RepID=A0A8J3MPP7_9CHLR|nr:class F sortase [Ktedonospora formicarum]GHO43135.1 hypothetical protein KSX_12980 [Ktedonospora formicarum]